MQRDRKMILAILLVACALSLHADERPTGSVRGIIFDPPGRKGIAHALVSVVGTQHRSLTDETGHFQIDGVPVGKHWLDVLSPEMTEASREFTIFSGDTTTISPLYLRFFGLSDDQAAAESLGVDVPWGAGALTCQIRPARKAFQVGDHPDFVVAITNRGKGPLTLVYALDGSDGGRFPRAKILIEGLDGGSLTRKMARCGNNSEIGLEDFVQVEPGQTIDPYAKGWKPMITLETFQQPGRYRATFTYSTKQPDVRYWLGFPNTSLDPRLSGRFRDVPMVELTATTEFTVADSPPQIEGIQDWTHPSPAGAVPPSAPITPRRPRRRAFRRRGARPRGLAWRGAICWRFSPY